MQKLNKEAVIPHCGICHKQFEVPGCPQRFDTADLTIPPDCPLQDCEVIENDYIDSNTFYEEIGKSRHKDIAKIIIVYKSSHGNILSTTGTLTIKDDKDVQVTKDLVNRFNENTKTYRSKRKRKVVL